MTIFNFDIYEINDSTIHFFDMNKIGPLNVSSILTDDLVFAFKNNKEDKIDMINNEYVNIQMYYEHTIN